MKAENMPSSSGIFVRRILLLPNLLNGGSKLSEQRLPGIIFINFVYLRQRMCNMSETAKKSITASALAIIVLLFISKFFGLLREFAIAGFYGASADTDAFFLAISLPNILFSAIGASVSTCILPIYVEKLHQEDKRSASSYISTILSIFVLISVVLTILCILFADTLVGWFAPSFSGDTATTAIRLTKILFVSLTFMIIANILSSILNAHKSYTAPQLIAIPGSILTILAAWLFSQRFGIDAIAYATVAGSICQVAIQVPFLREKYRFRPELAIKDPDIKRTMCMVVPMIFGASLTQLNEIVDKILASGLGEGAVSAISYSNKLIFFMSGIVVTAITTTVFSAFSYQSVENEMDKLKTLLKRSIVYTMLILMPISAISFVFDYEIIQLVFLRGNFTAEAVRITSQAFVYYTCGILFSGINSIYTKVFYSLKKTLLPFITSACAIAVNICVSILLAPSLGVKGLAIGTSVSAFILFIINSIALYRLLDGFDVKGTIKTGLKVLLCTAAMTIVMLSFKWFVPISGYMDKFVLSVLLACIVYLLAMKFSKIEEFNHFKNSMFNLFHAIFRKKQHSA